MAGVRAAQKEKTRRALIQAAMNQLSAEHGYASLSLREVTREAGIAPTSFYRHFQNMEELGLTLVDEGGLALRQLLRQSRQQIANGGSIIRASVTTFMEFVANNTAIFRLLLQEKSGNSREFRLAVQREVEHFTAELVDYLVDEQDFPRQLAELQADAIVRIVFSAGADALDASPAERHQLLEATVAQVRIVARGAAVTRTSAMSVKS
ncbi:HTH-type transcriptional repressor FabR [Pseudidiomarina terrestris]|uniref:HTH-type transcriptional repressor FabR n=1 Tax=Pseudidiomarina terrestris TaxID=2820060 RepID=A0AAW7QZC3_9GAMM|nr:MULTISPECIES: HTH-type transcriptional repressor FabR [unclassified Pseudidiomarina]MDN7125546.1 HTH-type transcriptional repressor FabR [Pseudidiomarina sp. 1APP75-32.1]MDN7130591.1 HTH-type transcriptional repressor FabR [Pseudidiomarina sp. 1APR75-15]MDN7134232.1 HTH-type transcriptional repressor FabR [Pseudidiomarina sp. 1ASP75-5]MDN7137080.1 HTH-type transcriptional repressor FabR [Pseudidiomarina sp. 1ASP75-14]MEA3588340.1 HTH-type transcriptional repressor FabR [Pseudidiomarina sp. 